jgi:hypothetical protein
MRRDFLQVYRVRRIINSDSMAYSKFTLSFPLRKPYLCKMCRLTLKKLLFFLSANRPWKLALAGLPSMGRHL